MKTIPSPFGTGIDEFAMQEQMVDIVGGTKKADRLSYLYNNSYPIDMGWRNKKTKGEVFRSKAKREGFTDNQVDAFLQIQ